MLNQGSITYLKFVFSAPKTFGQLFEIFEKIQLNKNSLFLTQTAIPHFKKLPTKTTTVLFSWEANVIDNKPVCLIHLLLLLQLSQ